jgi:hypothetical protein
LVPSRDRAIGAADHRRDRAELARELRELLRDGLVRHRLALLLVVVTNVVFAADLAVDRRHEHLRDALRERLVAPGAELGLEADELPRARDVEDLDLHLGAAHQRPHRAGDRVRGLAALADHVGAPDDLAGRAPVHVDARGIVVEGGSVLDAEHAEARLLLQLLREEVLHERREPGGLGVARLEGGDQDRGLRLGRFGGEGGGEGEDREHEPSLPHPEPAATAGSHGDARSGPARRTSCRLRAARGARNGRPADRDSRRDRNRA